MPDDQERQITSSSSEDIQVLNNKIQKYLHFQNEIRNIISDDEQHKDAILEDVLNAIEKLSNTPTYYQLLTLGIATVRKRIKRNKLKIVLENLLRKIFDISLGWYSLDYEDLKETCDYVGGKEYFNRDDHRYIYIAIIQKLKQGPIRDKCFEYKVVDYVNEKLVDIRNNYLDFKKKEL